MTAKNRIILGTMTFGKTVEDGARITSMDEYKKCLDYFKSQGYDEIDTARSYIGGTQEAWTKEAGYKERGLTIATKHYPSSDGMHSATNLRAACEKSLAQLGTDSVDIYYLHAADRSVPFAETLETINELYKEGKFITFAISNYTAAEVAELCLTCKYNGWVRPTLYQGMYNAIVRMAEDELQVTLRRFGLDYVIYNPIAGGLLSGKIKSKDIVPTEGRFSTTAGSQGSNYRSRYFRDTTFEALKIIEESLQKHPDITMVETALRWCVHHSNLKMKNKGGNDGIIIGVSSYDQLVSNLKDLEKGPLPEDIVAALDVAWGIMKADHPNYWHKDNVYTYDTVASLFSQGAK